MKRIIYGEEGIEFNTEPIKELQAQVAANTKAIKDLKALTDNFQALTVKDLQGTTKVMLERVQNENNT